jgi:hypothetical protein
MKAGPHSVAIAKVVWMSPPGSNSRGAREALDRVRHSTWELHPLRLPTQVHSSTDPVTRKTRRGAIAR